MTALGVICLLTCLVLTSSAASELVSDCFTPGTEYVGGGLDHPVVTGLVSAQECQALCQFSQGCNFFTWFNGEHDVSITF